MNYPKEISPNPLITSTVEIRFTVDNPILKDDIVSLFYPKFNNVYPKVKEIQMAQQAGMIITHPIYFMFSNDIFSISFGTNVVSFENIGTYHLWDKYSENIKESLSILGDMKIAKTIERIGVRYASVFEGKAKIKEVFDLDLTIGENSDNEDIKVFFTEISEGRIKTLLQLAENVRLIKDNKVYNGVFIDIDAAHNFEHPIPFDMNIFDLIDELHSYEKKVFYSLLNKDFLQTLNPVYA